MQKCINKGQFNCIQFTKENRDESLGILEPNLNRKHVFIRGYDEYCTVEFSNGDINSYFYNDWYVIECMSWDFISYRHCTDYEFHEQYKLVE